MFGTDGFFKGTALGNDYLVLAVNSLSFPFTAATARALCARGSGIGADGIVALEPGGEDATVWNADGSTAEVSGNGLRIAAVALGLGGERAELVLRSAGRSYAIRKGRGANLRIELEPAVIRDPERLVALGGRAIPISVIDVGNPHAVLRAEACTEAEWPAVAAGIAVHPSFPAGANVERLRLAAPGTIDILIHERGVGATTASGTGACAAAAAAVALGLFAPGTLEVRMPGGTVSVLVEPGRLALEGPVEALCRGRIDPRFAARLSG